MSSENNILIFGVGGTGCRVLSKLVKAKIPGLAFAAIDTDISALDQLPDTVMKIAAGTDWTWREGSGCGGDMIRGEQAVAQERGKLSELFSNCKMIVVTAGLGGGLATGGIRTIASVIRAVKKPAVFLLTTPFSFESFSRRNISDECISELLPVTDILLRIPNDLLFSQIPADSPAAAAFDLSCSELARTAVGIASILNAEHTLTADYDGFMSLLRNQKCLCTLGAGTASPSDGDRCTEAVKRMLQSPFLGGVQSFEQVDAAIISLCGGNDLQIGEMKRTLENIAGMLPKNARIISGFSTAEYMHDSVQVLMITARFETPIAERCTTATVAVTAEPVVKKHRGRRTIHDNTPDLMGMEQGEFLLPVFSKGIFANTIPIRWNDIDLDVPTFQRKEISIVDKGGIRR